MANDRYVWIRCFPQRKKILVGEKEFCFLTLQGVRARKAKVRERSDWLVDYNSPMVKYLLKFRRCFFALASSQINLTAHERGVERVPTVAAARRPPQFVGPCDLQPVDCVSGLSLIQSQYPAERRR